MMADNGIFVQGTTVNLAGTISLDDLTLPNGWGLTDASLSIDTLSNTYSGSAEVHIPGLFDVAGSITFLNGSLDNLSLSISHLASPIPIVDVPGLFLTGGSASITNLAPTASSPVTSAGTLDFSYGPEIDVDLPDWLGGDVHAAIATLEVGASMSTADLTGSVTLHILQVSDGQGGSLATVEGDADLNLARSTFTARGSIEVADGVYSGSGRLTIGDGRVTLFATGTAK